MKKIILCFFLYVLLSGMIVVTVLKPGSLTKSQPQFFYYFSIFVIVLGTLWSIKATFFMILAPWYTYIWNRRRRFFARRNYRPLVSVIIPAWNEEIGLISTVKTILASSYRSLEIIAVNDGSTDRSDEIMRTFIQKYQSTIGSLSNAIPIIYHYKPNGGKGSALNTGISLSHGEIIVTFDADSIIHKDAIKHFVSYFADPQIMAAAGNIKVGNTRTILGLIQSLEYYFGFQIKKAEALLGIIFVIGGAASAFRRNVFYEVGGYSTDSLTEDLDLSLRIQEAGMRIIYAPEAIVHTEGPTTLQGLFKQRLRWKRGRLEAVRSHRSSFLHWNKTGNKFFFWIILPLIMLGDIEIVIGSTYIVLLYIYSFMAHDFFYLLLTISFAGIVFALQLSEDRQFRKFAYFLLAPIIYFLLHFTTFLELNALIQALYTYWRKQEAKWQKWQRTGVADS